MQMSEGRFFSKDFSTDFRQGVILNETAIKAMEMKLPIGKQFSYYWGQDTRIIGVIKDFHYKPFYKEIEPLIIRLATDNFNYMTIRIRPLQLSEFDDIVNFIKKNWKNYRFDYTFELHFLDERIDGLYGAEQRMSKIFSYITFLTIFIACLGLFGLSSYSIERQIKEIGIRKVLGASVSQITIMLFRDFTKLVLIANIFAWPLAYYAMNKWIQNFAYRMEFSWWIFFLAGGLTLFIAQLTISWQAIRAATANPVEALRYE
jgi:putative ABC transport system permease protein